ncbi:MAG: alpha/beta hydrolase [Spirochaetae bacterium HGW-Spirochaetae-9]|nr:MAG: alpha/beta hydrolase [Spirochaetae bacterium HGW-Spirochaetae-9]
MIFRYSEAPSVNSIIIEKMLWAAKVKVSQGSEKPDFRARDYSKSIVSPHPPEHLRLRVDVGKSECAGRSVHWISSKAGAGSTTVLFLHGGSYIINATRPHWRYLAGLAELSGCTVVAPDYPLAPAHYYADAYLMLIELYRQLCAEEGPRKIVLMGDSAGGGLALGLAMMLRDEKMPAPEAIVMLSPWLDVTMSNPHIGEIDHSDPFLNVGALIRAGQSWARGSNPRKPLISPIYGQLENLPPLHLFIGTKDILAADCRRFRGLCLAAKARLAYYEFEGMVHDWMLLDFKEAKMAAAQIASIITGIGDL